MAVSAEKTRHTVTLPTTLVERLTREQGAGQTLSDVLRMRLEKTYEGMDAQLDSLTQRVEQMAGEVAVIRAAIEQLVGMFETRAKAPTSTTETEAPLPVVSYEELYRASPEPKIPEVEVPQEHKRWWHRST